MKVMVFHIGRERFGLPLASLVRVLPAARLAALPLAPDYVPGLLDLQGEPVPVIDLDRLAGAPRTAIHYDTRILLVDYPGEDGRRHKLGLQAARVTGVETVDAGRVAANGVTAAPFLGEVAGNENGMLQLVDLDGLLPPPVRALLFQPKAAA